MFPRDLGRLVLCLLLALSLFAPCAASRASSLSGKDVQIIAKVLGFLDPPAADGLVAVAFAAGNAASRADAMETVALFGGGLRIGQGVVRAEAVDAASLAAGRHYVAVIAAAEAPADIIMQAVRTLRIPCITGEVAQVRAGRCVMAVHSEPRVDIVLNRDLATSAGISFASAFRMLVHEI